MELKTEILFAVAGMIGAPAGSYLSTLFPESTLLVLFGWYLARRLGRQEAQWANFA